MFVMKTEPTEALEQLADAYIEKMGGQSLGSPINALYTGYVDGFKYGQSSPKIKQLEWFRYRDGREISETSIGNFYMDSPNIGKIRVDLMETFCGYFDSVDEAKRQAQNIFERRIKECLDL